MNYFISYGDDRFKVSLDRIARQARRVGIFDKIIKYTPKDLPEYIKASPLFAFSKGGGYWCWKPYIIHKTLKKCRPGDLVFYCDAGCTLDKDSSEWGMFLQAMEDHNSLFFQYRNGYSYAWGVNCDKPAIKHWIKPSAASFFLQYIDCGFLDYNKIWGGFMVFKKTDLGSTILDEWLKLTLFHPELIVDSYGKDRVSQNDFYHTHDQAILTPIVYLYREKDKALVIPETAESGLGTPAVRGTRWMQGKLPCLRHMKYKIWNLLNER